MPEIVVALGLVEAGRRGANHVATERCNLDSAEHRRAITRDQVRGKPCRWCFPNGLPEA
jgi:hypothetical protein